MLSSLTGFFLIFVEESIDNILKVTEETLRQGDHSVSNIDKQMNPLEKTNGLIGIWLPIKVTAGLSYG